MFSYPSEWETIGNADSMQALRICVQVFMPLHDAAGFHWLLLAVDLRDHCYWVYDSMSAAADADRAILVNSAVCITFVIHFTCHFHQLCPYLFLISVTVVEKGSRIVPYAVVDRCPTLTMGYSVCCVSPSGQVSRPPTPSTPTLSPLYASFTFVALMRYGFVVAMTVGCT